MIESPMIEFLRSGYALAAAALAWAGLLYLLLVSCWAVGRLRLHRRPSEAPLITDDGPAIGERLGREFMEPIARAARTGRGSRCRLTVIFAAAGCAPCVDLLPHLGPWSRRWRHDMKAVVVLETSGIAESHPAMAAWGCLTLPVLRDADGGMARSLGIRHRPMALLLDPAGIVLMKGVASNGAHLDALVQEWGVAVGERMWKPVVGW
jgi:hypothetical protein